jgi:hypothetical protein
MSMACQRRRQRRCIIPKTDIVVAVVIATIFLQSADAFSLFQLAEPWNNNNHHRHHFFTQVISDVDDTLKSSGGVNVAGIALGGIDVEYERNDMYPGVAEFLYELSRHTAQPAVPKVAILTARAEEFKAVLELKPTSSLAQALVQAGEQQQHDDDDDEWGIGPVLYGSVAEWIAQCRKGLRKFTNFERLLAQDPTQQVFRYIYVGDTGELDQEAGETMLREYPHLVQAVFLHVVSGDPLNQRQIPVPPLKLIQGRPLVFFRTYVGAAAMAVQLNLMTPAGFERVVIAAQRKLQSVPQTSSKWWNVQQDMDEARARGLFHVPTVAS